MALSQEAYLQSSANDLIAGIKNKNFTALDVVNTALERINSVNENIGAFLSVLNDSAVELAKFTDQQIAEGKDPGPLAGVPIAVKDNLALKGSVTSCASKMLKNYEAPYTATAVQRIIDAGGIPIGKTNLDEFAMGSSTENSGLQQTKNPWNTNCVPGGSSGGSAAAVASGCVPLALGSDTGGSIRQPAAFCGTVGIKPTYGMVSRFGLVAFASSLDQVGVFAGNAEDTALLLSVIAGPDTNDGTCSKENPPEELSSVTGGEFSLQGKKIGLPKEYFETEGIDSDVQKSVQEAVDVFRSLGAETVEVSLPNTKYAVATYYIIAPAEASSNLARYDGVHYGHRTEDPLIDKDKATLIQMYEKTRAEGFGPEVKRRIMLGTYALSSGYYDAYYLKAQKVRSLIKADFEKAFNEVDILLSPTTPSAAFGIGENIDDPLSMYLQDIFTISANLATVPAVSIPCGFTSNNLPIGLQLTAPVRGDGKLLQWANAYQSKTDHHTKRPNI